jgi:putative redox protein
MVEINMVYEGDLHCSVIHGPSGNRLETDAPGDNQGRGEAFSPTDLVAAALGTCMLTMMGIYARKHQLEIGGLKARVVKKMVNEPVRRIGRIEVEFTSGNPVSDLHRTGLEKAAGSCPVARSLHPEVSEKVIFNWT